MEVLVKEVNIPNVIDTLARRINQGICVLFIGPGALRTEQGRSLNSAFALSLASELRDEEIYFDEQEQDNMPYMIQCYINGKNEKYKNNSLKIVDMRDKFRNFIDTTKIDYSIYEQLATIPFSLVINTNYDKYFADLFRKYHSRQGKKVQFSVYDLSNQESDMGNTVSKYSDHKLVAPGRNNSLVYNIFGLCEEDTINSMILTEAEFVRYVARIHQANSNIPFEITNYIDAQKYCFFLGFDLDQWYYKIIIRALRNSGMSHSDIELIQPETLALGLPAYNTTAFFYEKVYQFCFINNEVDVFLEKLRAKLGPVNNKLPSNSNNDRPESPIRVSFVCDINSEKDVWYRDQISKQLMPLTRSGHITLWTEELARGISLSANISEQLSNSEIIMTLVSADFIVSEKNAFIEEIRPIRNEVIKLAVLLRPCAYKYIKELEDFTWLLTKKSGEPKALSEYTANEEETKINSITQVIIKNVNNIINHDCR